MSHKSQVIDYLKSVLYWKNEWTIPLILYGANVCKLHSTNKKIHMFPYIIWSYMIHQEKKKKANKKIKKFLFLQLMVGCMNSNYYNPKVWQNYSWYLTFDVRKRTMKKKISNPPPIEYWCGFNIGEY